MTGNDRHVIRQISVIYDANRMGEASTPQFVAILVNSFAPVRVSKKDD